MAQTEKCDRCESVVSSYRMVTIVNRWGQVEDICSSCDHDSRRAR